MDRNILRTGKKSRPKTAVKGNRYRCAKCHKRSPKPVKTPAPWYCPKCRIALEGERGFDAPETTASRSPSSDGINDPRPLVPGVQLRQHVGLDLVAVGKLVRHVEQADDREHLAQGFR